MPPAPRAEPGALTQAGRQRLLVGPHGPLDLPHIGGRRGWLRWDTEARAPAASQPGVPAPPRPLVPGAVPPRPAEQLCVRSSGPAPAPRRQAAGAGGATLVGHSGSLPGPLAFKLAVLRGPRLTSSSALGPSAGPAHLDACLVLGVCSASSSATWSALSIAWGSGHWGRGTGTRPQMLNSCKCQQGLLWKV